MISKLTLLTQDCFVAPFLAMTDKYATASLIITLFHDIKEQANNYQFHIV